MLVQNMNEKQRMSEVVSFQKKSAVKAESEYNRFSDNSNLGKEELKLKD